MNNAQSGKRKAKATTLPTRGKAPKKLREVEQDGQAVYKASDADRGAEAMRVVAADEDGVDVAAVEAEHRMLEARCERPVRAIVAAAVAAAPAPLGAALRRPRVEAPTVTPALRSRRWQARPSHPH